MKKTKRLWALLLAMVMALGLITTAFAAPTIDSGRKASLSLYKYDITAASADGAWDATSYVSTGVQDDAVTDKLAQYAIQGVEFICGWRPSPLTVSGRAASTRWVCCTDLRTTQCSRPLD